VSRSSIPHSVSRSWKYRASGNIVLQSPMSSLSWNLPTFCFNRSPKSQHAIVVHRCPDWDFLLNFDYRICRLRAPCWPAAKHASMSTHTHTHTLRQISLSHRTKTQTKKPPRIVTNCPNHTPVIKETTSHTLQSKNEHNLRVASGYRRTRKSPKS